MTTAGTRRSAPRVLFVTHHLPYPPFSGGRRREFELITRLAADFDIHLCAVTKTHEDDRAHADAFREWCGSVALFPATPHGGPRAGAVAPQVALHASDAATAHVMYALKSGHFEAIHVEGFYLMHHLPRDPPVPVLLGEQNVEFELWRQRARLAHDEDEQERLQLAWRRTRRDERRAWREADLCAAVTQDDLDVMVAHAPNLDVRLVPDGCDHSSRLPGDSGAVQAEEAEGAVVMVGNLAYQPNADAALRMCRKVFPRVRARVPDARLVVVGNGPPRDVLDAASAQAGITVTGRVPAVEPYLDAAAVVACPLRVGGGVKVKMLEALTRGKAIVTSPLGLQGLGHDAARCVRVADDDEAFAAAIVRLLDDVHERRTLEGAAFAFAARLPTWDEAAQALASCYEDLLTSGARRVAA